MLKAGLTSLLSDAVLMPEVWAQFIVVDLTSLDGGSVLLLPASTNKLSVRFRVC